MRFSSLSLSVAVADAIVTQTHCYGWSGVLNTTVLYTSILEPMTGSGGSFNTLQAVGSLALRQAPVPGPEGHPFPSQPSLQVLDSSVNVFLLLLFFLLD
jgi:hypothetical protein